MKFDSSAFYAALIHELKNSLAVLSMTIERIPRQGEPEHDVTVDAAQLQCQGVADRLHQALLVYKAENGQISPTLDAYSPHDLVSEIAGSARALAHDRFHIETVVAADVPPLWFFDRELIEMALINAIHNAISYAHSTIRIEADMLEARLALSVRDDSPGYPEHILASLAEGKPYQATGTGLGLQFSRLIAQSHDNRGCTGELRLSNDPGAVFTLLLP